MVALASIKRVYNSLPQLKRPIADAIRDVRKNPELRSQLSSATAIDRVHIVLAGRRGGKKKAIASLERIADRHPDTPADTYAREWITRLQADQENVDATRSTP